MEFSAFLLNSQNFLSRYLTNVLGGFGFYEILGFFGLTLLCIFGECARKFFNNLTTLKTWNQELC